MSFIAADNPDAAGEVLNRIEKNLTSLQAHPMIGKVPDDKELAKIGYRYVVILDYLIFYTIQRKTILIHRIIHGARNYKDLL